FCAKTVLCCQKYGQLAHIPKVKRDLRLYLPRLGQKFENANRCRCIATALVMPFCTDAEALDFIMPPLQRWKDDSQKTYFPVIGMDTLTKGNIQTLTGRITHASGSFMTDELAEDLRLWLYEPRHKADQRKPIILDAIQEKLATSRTKSGYRRIRGPAGSGKSLILAARAANLLREGKTILVVTFNITLCNYLRDLTARYAQDIPAIQKKITFLNYHSWAKRVCFASDNADRYRALWADKDRILTKILEDSIPALVP
ncbi:hypothetical protein, partial [Kistimonas scapharcae]|uniref:hypothetical protein n=1 Tax=Kistimonas scapharcae TaxID=1036133 RepID=UPI0031EE53BA